MLYEKENTIQNSGTNPPEYFEKNLLAFIAENEGKELLIKNNEKANEKITVKCKNGMKLENLLNSVNGFYKSKIVVEEEKIILE